MSIDKFTESFIVQAEQGGLMVRVWLTWKTALFGSIIDTDCIDLIGGRLREIVIDTLNLNAKVAVHAKALELHHVLSDPRDASTTALCIEISINERFAPADADNATAQIAQSVCSYIKEHIEPTNTLMARAIIGSQFGRLNQLRVRLHVARSTHQKIV